MNYCSLIKKVYRELRKGCGTLLIHIHSPKCLFSVDHLSQVTILNVQGQNRSQSQPYTRVVNENEKTEFRIMFGFGEKRFKRIFCVSYRFFYFSKAEI